SSSAATSASPKPRRSNRRRRGGAGNASLMRESPPKGGSAEIGSGAAPTAFVPSLTANARRARRRGRGQVCCLLFTGPGSGLLFAVWSYLRLWPRLLLGL